MPLKVCWVGGPGDGRWIELSDVDEPLDRLSYIDVGEGGGQYGLGEYDEANHCWRYHYIEEE